MRRRGHARLRESLGAAGLPLALLCIGYVGFARWQRATEPPAAARRGIPPAAHEEASGRTVAVVSPARSAEVAPPGRESRPLEQAGSTAGGFPPSRSAHLESPSPGRPVIGPAPDLGEALAAVGDQEALSAEESLQARENEPSSPRLVMVTSRGRVGTESGTVPAALPAPVPGTSRPVAGGGAKAFSPQSPRSNSRIWMVPRTANVKVGDRIAVRVEIAQGIDVGSVPFHLLFNPAVLRFDGAEEGTFLKGTGRETVFLAAPAVSGNELIVGLSRLGGGAGNDGAGELCIINFSVIGAGEAGLAFSRARVVDSQSQIVPSRFEAASITAH